MPAPSQHNDIVRHTAASPALCYNEELLLSTTDTAPAAGDTVESGLLKIEGKTMYLLTDPRAKFYFRPITAEGAGFSDLHRGFVFGPNQKDDFDRWCDILSQRALLPIDNDRGSARYAHEELTRNLKCVYVDRPRFPDNPRSTTERFYFAPNEEAQEKANKVVFEKSRASTEQIQQIRDGIAAGKLNYDNMKMTPKEFEDKLAERQVSIGEAKGLLNHIEPPTEAVIAKIREHVTKGKLNDRVLAGLVEDGHKLTREQAELGVAGLLEALETPEALTFTLRNAYDIDSAAKRMADIEQQRQVKAYEQMGMLKAAGAIEYDNLTASKARSLIASGNAVSIGRGKDFDERVAELQREGWTSAGLSSSHSRDGRDDRNIAEHTHQGGAKISEENVRQFMKENFPGQSAADWPERGYATGEIVYADSFNVVLNTPNGPLIGDMDQLLRFEESYTPKEHVGEYVGLVIGKRGPFGVGLPTATNHGEAIVLLDAQQFKRNEDTPFVPVDPPSAPTPGKVAAVRGQYAAIDIANGSTFPAPLSSLDNPTPKFGQSVTFTPAVDVALPGQSPNSPAPTKSKARGRS